MIAGNLERARLLFEQGRYPMAVEELGHQLAQEPDDPFGHSLLALCLSKMKRHDDAIREAQTAVHLAPDLPHSYYVLGSVLDDVGRLRESEAAAREAVRLDPEEADYFALLASIRVQQRQWADALHNAEIGLSLEPDHVGCANLKAMALVNLGRRQEAGATIQTTLAKEPENATTHANQGWALLHAGDHQAAMEHFREALRLNPGSEWAREGILEALRARNPIYRVMLRYFLWMSRLRGKAQFGIVLGAWFGYQIVRAVQRSSPALAPFLTPVVVLYLLFAYLTWTAKPLFNLLLRLDKFGRYALTPNQRTGSQWFGGYLLAALLSLGGACATNRASLWFLALACLLLTLPVAVIFARAEDPRRNWKGGATLLLTAFALTAAAVCFFQGPKVADSLFTAFFVGLGAFVWITNLTSARADDR